MGKRKPKEIHVDKLIINAGEVIIVDEGRKSGQWDPWLGRVQQEQEDVDVDIEVNSVAGDDVNVDIDVDVDTDDTPPRRPFSWI
jgi:hypothetical protein